MPRHRTPRAAARTLQEQAARHAATLARLADWPEGMPPLSGIGSGIGCLTTLEREGLAERLERDRLGDPRFRLTPAGWERLSQS